MRKANETAITKFEFSRKLLSIRRAPVRLQILDKFELGQILRQPVIRSHACRADTNSMFSGKLLERNPFSFYKRDVSQIDDCRFGALAGILARK